MTTHITLGIDPGRTGAIVALTGTFEVPTLVEVLDAPAYYPKESPICFPHGIRGMIERIRAKFPEGCDISAYIETPGVRPHEAPSATLQTGKGFGSLLAILHIEGVPYTEVSPQRWAKALNITERDPSKRKHAHGVFACSKLPNGESVFYGPMGGLRDGRADAACIAVFGLKQQERK